MTRSKLCAIRCRACSLRRACAIDAITRFWPQNAPGSLRSSASWVVAHAISNLVSSSSRHCPTKDAGVSTRTLSTMPRSRYSLSTMPASMVLPRPTSSASSTRPRNCLSTLRTVSTWYQKETVRKVLKQFRGRVLLADEVGLGKTIEAGMVLKEYLLRGMVESVLVLTPASLVGQWREELETKFEIACATTHDALLRNDPGAFWGQKRVIASIAQARRSEHARHLMAHNFDLVIVDEAHHLRDRSSQSYKLVDGLNKRFLLLLSATPVQNDLTELYNLLTLLN